jgi:large subunit ribosomal protein L13
VNYEDLNMRTYVPKEGEITREWVVMDAADQILGRLATEAARLLRGKHKPDFTPHLDTGDFVVIVNAERVQLTGAKLDQKVYYRHSGRPGSLKSETARERLDKYPERVIQAAVWGMLPKNRLGRKLLSAQQPKTHTL